MDDSHVWSVAWSSSSVFSRERGDRQRKKGCACADRARREKVCIDVFGEGSLPYCR